MSAITGMYHLNGEPITPDISRGIMKAIQHCPADDVQTWHKGNVFFGCHAQWITPESVGEQLPFYDYKNQMIITADAIIDNRHELFEKLKVESELRRTMPDSELILRAYRKWGQDVPKFLIGDFAFMIWDEKKLQLFGARDFSGSRTLYYYFDKKRFAFCTLIRPLFSLKYPNRDLNEQWLADFLAIPGMLDSVDTSSTVYKSIKQVPPSHTILVSGEQIFLSKYSSIAHQEKLKLKTDQEYREAFREVFQSAVSARTRTRYNVGARLSGGLDSGSVASFAAKALKSQSKQLHTFSYVPPSDFVDWTPKSRIADERPFIKSTVQYVGNIKDHYLDFAGKSPFSEVDDMLEIMEMPYKYFGNSFWLKGIYEKASQNQIGILLGGGRGNYTISWGPALEYYAILLKNFNWLRLYHELQLYSKNLGINKARVLKTIRNKAFPMLNRVFSPIDAYHYPQLINTEFAKRTSVFDRLQANGIDVSGTSASVPDFYKARQQRFEQLCYWNIPGTSGTKLSLRYSLWERDPTNDLRVVRFCLAVPDEQFVQQGLDRALIRRSTEGYLPDKVRLNQRVKGVQGADTVHRMMPVWKDFIEELQQLCKDSHVSYFFNLDTIKSALKKMKDNPRPEYAIDLDFKILTRSLIVYRFLKKLT